MTHILHIDSSARSAGSVTRALTQKIVDQLSVEGTTVTRRDLAAGLPVITADWVGANFTPAADRDAAKKAVLAESDALVAELQAADVIVIGLPIYNFGVPTSLKSWIDLIARAGLTFAYTAEGPKGLLTGKRAIVAVASGGVPVGSAYDFATTYLKQVLGFVGITEVEFIVADALGQGDAEKVAAANEAISKLAA